jgi:hypothetical protein
MMNIQSVTTKTAAALRSCFARCSFASINDVALALGTKPATFAACLAQPGSRTKALIEAQGYRVDLRNDRIERV